jgi:hypothetical protein
VTHIDSTRCTKTAETLTLASTRWVTWALQLLCLDLTHPPPSPGVLTVGVMQSFKDCITKLVILPHRTL